MLIRKSNSSYGDPLKSHEDVPLDPSRLQVPPLTSCMKSGLADTLHEVRANTIVRANTRVLLVRYTIGWS